MPDKNFSPLNKNINSLPSLFLNLPFIFHKQINDVTTQEREKKQYKYSLKVIYESEITNCKTILAKLPFFLL